MFPQEKGACLRLFSAQIRKMTHFPDGTKPNLAPRPPELPPQALEKPSEKRRPPDSLFGANRTPAEERPPMFHHWIKPRRNGPPRCKFSIVREVAARQRFAANPKPPKQAPLGVNLPSAEAADQQRFIANPSSPKQPRSMQTFHRQRSGKPKRFTANPNPPKRHPPGAISKSMKER